ncbi:hypothetical protein QRD38_04380 [Leptospira weilii]|uniref:hypothetical protein n=1 Tax=Leptospira weilii TaxID=28184 RepID=UPI0002DFCC35|nr:MULTISPECIES: hypothetical protein [Leptospira]MDL5245043.1 hypothetical protein [Leptospira weilii]
MDWDSLKENRRMIRLMAIASALLEKNVVYESALRFQNSVHTSVLEPTRNFAGF